MKTRSILFAPFALTSVLIGVNIAHAQTYTPSNRIPVADKTLGTQVSGNNNNFNITGGLNKGQSLFHSFSDFSVPTNGQANFLNPVGSRDIITRVTGRLFSDINGTVNTQGANFFLINPHGLVFGPNAQLNVGKAFVGSTANSIDLVDGSGRTVTFGTNPNGDAPLLSVNPNVFFNVSRLNLGGGTGQINNFGTLQTTNLNQYIGLIGGDVNMNGGQINTPGGRVEIGGLSAFGTVSLGIDVNNIRAQFPANVGRGDVSLTNGARVNVAGAGGGDIAISARNLAILGGSVVRGGIETGLGTPKAVAGDIKLDTTGSIVAVGSTSGIGNSVRLNSQGNGGNITVNAHSLSLQDGASFQASTSGKGNAGKITIETQENLSLNNQGNISSIIFPQGEGNSNGITISAKDFNLLNRSFISTSNAGGTGNAGNIDIKATGDLTIVGYDRSIPAADRINYNSFISSGTYGKGDTGKITIDTNGNLLLNNQAGIASGIFTQAQGNSQGITINVKNLSLLNNSDIGASNSGGKGTAGDINIKTTGDLTIAGYTDRSMPLSARDNYRSFILSDTSGPGDTGKININAQGNISLDNNAFISSSIFPQAEGNSKGISLSSKNLSLSNNSIISTLNNGGGQGNAGNIDIKTTGDIELIGFTDRSLPQSEKDRSLATISSSTSGKGDTGKITIEAQGNLSLDRKGTIFSNIDTQGEGNSRGISIHAKNVSLKNTGQISTANLDGKGNAGNINIQSNGTVDLTNSSSISSASTGQGQAANISISSQKLNLNQSLIYTVGFSVGGGDIALALSDLLLLRNNSLISTTSDSTGKNGNGGNITINSPLIVATPGNNDISANAYAGNGGQVNITSQGLFGIQYRPKGQESPFTNDITASSTFGQNGSVNINTPGTDPGKDKGELNAAPNDASKQISQACSASQRDNKFYITGRGGHPANAEDPLTSEVVWLDPRVAQTQPVANHVNSQTTRKLAPPAVGWIFDGKDQVTLIAAETEGVLSGRVVCPKVEK